MDRLWNVEWAPVALGDLERILDYVVSSDGRERAEAVAERILGRVSTLRSNPARCRIVPELRETGILDFRELLVGPYRAIYLTREAAVSVVALLDGRRDLGEILLERATRELP